MSLLTILLIGIIIFLLWLLLRRKKEPEVGEGETGPVREAIKEIIRERQHNMCGYPNCTYDITLMLHHIVPRNQGGDNRLSNLVYLCPNHHAEMHIDENGNLNYKDDPDFI